MQRLNDKFDKVRQELRRRWLVLSVTLVSMDSAIAILFFNLFHFREQTALYTFVGLCLLELLFLVLLFIHSVRRPGAVALAKRVEELDLSFQNGLICAVEKELIPESDRTIFEQLLVEEYQEESKVSDEKIRTSVLSKWLKTSFLIVSVVLTFVLCVLALETDFSKKASSGLNHAQKFEITPEKLQTSIYSDFTVSVKVLRWEQAAHISFEENGEWVSYPMNRTDNISSFTFYNLTENQPFVISTASLMSEQKTITVYTPPKVENVTLEVVPPSYTKIKPTQTFSFNNLTVLEGSTIKANFAVKPEGCRSRFLLNKRDLKSSQKGGLQQFVFQVNQSGHYQVELNDQKGHVVLTPSYAIEVIPDQVPAISVIKPGRDTTTMTNKPLTIEVTSADDFGIRDIVLHTSISGRETTRVCYRFKGDDSKLKIDFKSTLDPQDFDAKGGDVIKYYFTILDNREPRAQKGRSDIFFLSVIEDIKKKEIKSKGQGKKKKKKVKMSPLITEVKRLIRLTHDSLYLDTEDRKKESMVIAMALADLKINIKKLIVDIKKKGPLPSMLNVAFSDAVKHSELAEKSSRSEKPKDSIFNQEVVLNKLSLIAFELSKNKPKVKSESKKSSDSSGESKKKPQNKNQMKMDLADLKKALKTLQQQSQAQGKQNRKIRAQLGSQSNQQELKQLKQKQDAISAEIKKVKEDLKLDSEDALSKQLNRASEKSSDTVNQLNQFRANQALREGQQTQKELLKAAGQVTDKIAGLVKQALAKIAQQAKDLAQSQAKLSEKTGGLKRSDMAGQEAAKRSQQDLKKAVNKLRAQQQAMAQHTAELYPKLSEALFKGASFILS